jgi:hypothetical protein
VWLKYEVISILEFLVFQIGNYGKKNKIGGGKKTPCHFGQVNFNMSGVIGVVFFTGKIKTI